MHVPSVPASVRLPGALARPRFAYFGMLFGHIWIWEVCHLAGAANPDLTPTVTVYVAMTLFLLGVTIAAVAFRPAQTSLAWADWPLAALMAVGTLLLTCPLPASWPRAALVGAAAIFGGIGIGWTYLQWAFFYAGLGARNAIACIFGAMVLGSLLKIPLDVLPPAFSGALCALLPFASPLACRLAQARPPAVEPATPEAYYNLRTLQPLVKLLVGVAAYGLVIGIMQGMVIEADPAPKWLLSAVHHLLEVVSALAVLWFVFVKRRSLPFCNVWRTVLVFTATGIVLLPVFGRVFSGWALVAVGVAQTLVVMLLWAMLADVAHHSSLSPLAVFGLGWTAYCLPFPVGHALGSFFTLDAAGDALITVIVYLLAMASVFLLDERDFSRNRIFADLEQPLPPRSLFGAVENTCDRLAAPAELTERETEVMKLICQGRSKGYIAETLCISENTVRSHARHLYAKLDVHSKQELLDLVLSNVHGDAAH